MKKSIHLSLHYTFFLSVTLSLHQTVYCDRVRRFPHEFKFGAASASYQVEGAWNADNKTENIWDHLTHSSTCAVRDCSNGDIADNSYYLYKRDVEIIRELGLDFYRFSLSWNRILPTSFPDKINKAGVEYYNNLINELLKYNIEPIVTIYHWDLPQKLQELGGWTNVEIVNWFSDYARTVFTLFGDRVKYWITINEPQQICYYGYGMKFLAPALDIKGIAEYMCAKNLLVAHAKAYHIYNEEFRRQQQGSIFITINAEWYEPESKNDAQAAEESKQFYWGMFTHPIFSRKGDFPPVLKNKILYKSTVQGFYRSRLPEFTPEEVKLIRGSSDYFGLNHYSTRIVYRNSSVYNINEVPSFLDDLEAAEYQPTQWQIGNSNFTRYAPWGFYKLLKEIKRLYGNPAVIITENGFASYGGLADNDRVRYMRGYLTAVLDAIADGCDIRAYAAWSLLDNFEWIYGYTERFGLYEVDYSTPTRNRTARKSAYVYKEILRTRTLDLQYEPDINHPITIDGYTNL